MVGSAIDGEDIVQEAMAKAIEALPATGRIERPENWLFRIAYNTALDELRRRKRRNPVLADDLGREAMADPFTAADARVAVTANLATFLNLPVIQRSCVVLGDILGYSLAEIVEIVGLTLPAVKAALHRARGRLRELANQPDGPRPRLTQEERDRLQAYADRFNERDFDALRDLLAEDVRLEVVNRIRLAGRKDVSEYFNHYEAVFNWRLSIGIAEGRPALIVRDPGEMGHDPGYIVLVSWMNGEITAIRDFRHASYVIESMTVLPA
jgi:RNA polymerase sigma-70 factor, ECF subfamily